MKYWLLITITLFLVGCGETPFEFPVYLYDDNDSADDDTMDNDSADDDSTEDYTWVDDDDSGWPL